MKLSKQSDFYSNLSSKKTNFFFDHDFEQGIASLEGLNLMGMNYIMSQQWFKDENGRQYAIPTYLTGRRLNLRIALRW